MSDHVILIDNIGRIWCFLVHAPMTIVQAVRESVRRWRAGNIGKLLPDLIPLQADFGEESSMIVPVVAPVAKLSSERHSHQEMIVISKADLQALLTKKFAAVEALIAASHARALQEALQAAEERAVGAIREATRRAISLVRKRSSTQMDA